MEVPYQLTVDRDRKRVFVLNFGHGAVVSFKGMYYPHNYTVRTMVHGVELVGRLILTPELKVLYQFTAGELVGEAKKTPTGALDSIFALLGHAKYRKGTNGCLHFGLAYEIPQAAVRQARGLPELQGAGDGVRLVRAGGPEPDDNDLLGGDLFEDDLLFEHGDDLPEDHPSPERKAEKLCEEGINFADFDRQLEADDRYNELLFDRIPSPLEISDEDFFN